MGERRSERICKKKRDAIHPYEKESRKCEAYRFFVAYKREKDQKTNAWGSPVLLVRGREGPTIRE